MKLSLAKSDSSAQKHEAASCNSFHSSTSAKRRIETERGMISFYICLQTHLFLFYTLPPPFPCIFQLLYFPDLSSFVTPFLRFFTLSYLQLYPPFLFNILYHSFYFSVLKFSPYIYPRLCRRTKIANNTYCTT